MAKNEPTQPDSGKSPTIRDIAQICGVNHSTVSRALHNDTRLSSETIERIREVAREIGYDPMHYQEARRLISRRYGKPVLSHTLALFFFHRGFSQSNYFNKILQGILDAVVDEDFEVHTSDIYSDSKLREPLPYVYRRGDIDGALVIAQEERWGPVRELLRAEPGFAGRPIVGLVEPLTGCSGVYPDNVAAGYLAMSHLLDLGHKRIVALNLADHEGTNVQCQRLAGYQKACQERGLNIDEYLRDGFWDSNDRDETAIRLVEDLNQHPEVTALIARNDFEAVHAYRVLRRAGCRVPEDISLIGYDDTDVIADGRGDNILSTVRLPLYEVGRAGTRFLIQRILGQEPEDRDIVLPVELVVRKSTAPPSRG